MAPLFAAAVAGNEHARRIQLALRIEPHARGAHSGIGSVFDRAEQCREPAGIRNGVVIERRQIGSAGAPEGLIDGSAKACVDAVLNHGRVGTGSVAALHQLMAAVVHDDDLEVAPGLAFERPHAIDESIVCRQSWDDDGNAEEQRPN